MRSNSHSRPSTSAIQVDEIASSFDASAYTNLPSRHKSLPNHHDSFSRRASKHASSLSVRSGPAVVQDELSPEQLLQKKRLLQAYEVMKSCDADLWTDVCAMHSLMEAVEKYDDVFEADVRREVEEANTLMLYAYMLSCVETIESYRHEEWYVNEKADPHGAMMIAHRTETAAESKLDAQIRHAEFARAWDAMNKHKKIWNCACRFHIKERNIDASNKTKVCCIEKFGKKASSITIPLKLSAKYVSLLDSQLEGMPRRANSLVTHAA